MKEEMNCNPAEEMNCNSKDCEDKKSIHYFMCHMEQNEWNDIIKDKTLKKIEFNRIR